MQDIILEVKKREETGKKMRAIAQTNIPCVVYGHGFEAQSLWVDTTHFNRTLEKAGTSTIISVVIDGAKPVQALIHDYQVHPVTDQFIHIDLFHVRMDETVDTQIPIVTTGESNAIKNMGGTLNIIEHISVRALPGDLIHEIVIDISELATFDDRISVADLNLGDKIEILIDENTPVATVIAPRTQEEVDAADEEVVADVSKVEDVEVKKEEEEPTEEAAK